MLTVFFRADIAVWHFYWERPNKIVVTRNLALGEFDLYSSKIESNSRWLLLIECRGL